MSWYSGFLSLGFLLFMLPLVFFSFGHILEVCSNFVEGYHFFLFWVWFFSKTFGLVCIMFYFSVTFSSVLFWMLNVSSFVISLMEGLLVFMVFFFYCTEGVNKIVFILIISFIALVGLMANPFKKGGYVTGLLMFKVVMDFGLLISMGVVVNDFCVMGWEEVLGNSLFSLCEGWWGLLDESKISYYWVVGLFFLLSSFFYLFFFVGFWLMWAMMGESYVSMNMHTVGLVCIGLFIVMVGHSFGLVNSWYWEWLVVLAVYHALIFIFLYLLNPYSKSGNSYLSTCTISFSLMVFHCTGCDLNLTLLYMFYMGLFKMLVFSSVEWMMGSFSMVEGYFQNLVLESWGNWWSPSGGWIYFKLAFYLVLFFCLLGYIFSSFHLMKSMFDFPYSIGGSELVLFSFDSLGAIFFCKGFIFLGFLCSIWMEVWGKLEGYLVGMGESGESFGDKDFLSSEGGKWVIFMFQKISLKDLGVFIMIVCILGMYCFDVGGLGNFLTLFFFMGIKSALHWNKVWSGGSNKGFLGVSGSWFCWLWSGVCSKLLSTFYGMLGWLFEKSGVDIINSF